MDLILCTPQLKQNRAISDNADVFIPVAAVSASFVLPYAYPFPIHIQAKIPIRTVLLILAQNTRIF